MCPGIHLSAVLHVGCSTMSKLLPEFCKKTEQMQFIDVWYLAQACFTVYGEIGSWCTFFCIGELDLKPTDIIYHLQQ